MNFDVTFGSVERSVFAAVVVASKPVRFRAACRFYKTCASSAKSDRWACSDKFNDEQRKGMCLNYCRLYSAAKVKVKVEVKVDVVGGKC